jgi:predicted nucleic acid-binding protein
MLVDTDILIWYMRGHEGAARLVESLPSFCISAVTYMELVQGMRDRRELAALRSALRSWRASVLPVTEAVSGRAVAYVEAHFLSHSLRLADALVAATAVENGLELATANRKHYHAVRELTLRAFTP